MPSTERGAPISARQTDNHWRDRADCEAERPSSSLAAALALVACTRNFHHADPHAAAAQQAPRSV